MTIRTLPPELQKRLEEEGDKLVNQRIIEVLRSEKARQYVWENWKGDTELFDLLEELFRNG